MEKISIYQFSDPVCVWSWGNEPVMRAIDFLYGDKVKIEYIMGGLVENIASLYDLQGDTEEIIKRANAIVTKSWLMASERHGMPVVVGNNPLFTPRYPSSYPQNIAYEAAKRLDPQRAKIFLRSLREATFTEQRRTSQIDVILDLAECAGYDRTLFLDEYTTGNAQTDFTHDRMLCRRNGITGFPSYMIRNDDTSVIIGGFQNLRTFHSIISRLSAGRIKPRRIGPSIANVTEFLRRYSSVYTVEIETAFSLDCYQASLMVEQLCSTKKLCREEVGNTLRLSINRAQNQPLHQAKGQLNQQQKVEA